MLSADLKRLSDTYDAMMAGTLEPTEERMLAMARDLKHAVAKAHLIELGINPMLFDVVAASEAPGSNVVLLPVRHPMRHEPFPGSTP